MILINIRVSIPAISVPGIELYKTDVSFNHAPGQQTTLTEFPGWLLINTIHPLRVLRFSADVDQSWRFGLHPKRHFVGLHPSRKLIVVVALLKVAPIQRLNQLKITLLYFKADSRLWLQIEDRRRPGPHRDSLIRRRQIPATPRWRTTL